jgi:hypothetical protein
MPSDFTAAVARRFFDLHRERHLQCSPIGASKEDEPNAYRNVPSQHPHFNVAAIVSPRSGKVFFFIIRGHAFGFAASPPNFCQKSTLISIAAARLLAVPVSPYVDDFTTPEAEMSRGEPVPEASGWQQHPGSAQAGLWSTTRWLCSPLAPAKSREWNIISSSCGCTTDMTTAHLNGEVRVGVNPQPQVKTHALVSQLLHDRRLDLGRISTLIGKLGWMFIGKHGRAATQPLRRLDGNQSSDDNDHAFACLSFLQDVFASEIHQVIYYGIGHFHDEIATAFSDVTWKPQPPILFGVGCVAFVIIPPAGRPIFSAANVPTRILKRMHSLSPRKNPINALETMSMTGTYFCDDAHTIFSNRFVNHFGDNTAANGACTKGYSPRIDTARMIGPKCFLISTRQNKYSSMDRVRPFRGEPSRGQFSNMDRLDARRVNFNFPSLEEWDVW